MMTSFHRAWMMAIRCDEPSYFVGAAPKPLIVGSDIVDDKNVIND
jgi:hypothetical protein